MPSPRIEYAILPAGDGPGQDRCYTADGLVVVLDGASAYDPSVSPDASEYVDTLGPLLIEQITGTPGIDLRNALAEAIRQTTDKLALIPAKGPSSTVSIVRWGEEVVDVLVLGDSPVIGQFTDGSRETIVQHPMDHIAPGLRRLYRQRLAAGHGYDAEHRAVLARIQRSEAPLRNQDGGYWIAESQPSAAVRAEVRSFSPSYCASLVLMTDGAEQIARGEIDLPGIVSMTSDRLMNLLLELQIWEASTDPDGVKRHRSKRHDDKTVATVSPAQTWAKGERGDGGNYQGAL